MHKEIGKKIKKMAIVIFVLEAILFFIGAIILMAINNDLFLVGILMMIIGPLLAWVSSFILYGFGELIDKTSEIANNTSRTSANAILQNCSQRSSHDELKKLLEKGLISEDEYYQKVGLPSRR